MQASEDYCPVCGSKLERPIGTKPICGSQGKEEGPGRVFVRVTSFRRRLLDQGNLCTKHLIDAARYSGFFRDDSPKEIVEEVAQVQVVSKDEERTEIEIIYPADFKPLVNKRLFL